MSRATEPEHREDSQQIILGYLRAQTHNFGNGENPIPFNQIPHFNSIQGSQPSIWIDLDRSAQANSVRRPIPLRLCCTAARLNLITRASFN